MRRGGVGRVAGVRRVRRGYWVWAESSGIPRWMRSRPAAGGFDARAAPSVEKAGSWTQAQPAYTRCCSLPQGMWVFISGGGGGGGSIEPLKTGGGGFGKRAQLTGTINQSL